MTNIELDALQALAPCPFCKRSDIGLYSSDFQVTCHGECHDCGAKGPTEETEAQAIAAWNRRADTGKSAEACEYLTEYDFASLFRFNEICEDSDADGHDVPGAAMKRLEQIGVVRTMGFGRHEMTAFGHFVIEHTFLQKPTLPLRTHQDWNDIARRTASESTQPPQENTNV